MSSELVVFLGPSNVDCEKFKKRIQRVEPVSPLPPTLAGTCTYTHRGGVELCGDQVQGVPAAVGHHVEHARRDERPVARGRSEGEEHGGHAARRHADDGRQAPMWPMWSTRWMQAELPAFIGLRSFQEMFKSMHACRRTHHESAYQTP